MAKNIKLGSIIKGKEGNSDYIKLNDKVTLLYDGKPVTAKFINLQNPHTLPRILLEKKLISEEIAADMANKAAKVPFVRFDLTVKSEG